MYRGMNKFKKGYQSRTKTVEDKKGDLLADSHSIWLGTRITSINYRTYMERKMLDRLNTPESLVSEPSSCETEMATEKPKDINH